jgi:hypothetical protein
MNAPRTPFGMLSPTLRQATAFLFLCIVCITRADEVKITVVDMIPKSVSGETNQDSEPNLAVNPANPLQIAGSAFTPDPMLGPRAPIYVSTDGGNTWSLNSIVPSQAGSRVGTSDITIRFSNNTLYAGILRLPNPSPQPRLNILRTNNFVGPNLMAVLVDRTGNGVDQPYVQAATVADASGNGKDRIYVGNNDFNDLNNRSSTIDFSLDAASATASFKATRLDKRDTSGQDGPQIRPAISADGQSVYAIFYGWRDFTDGVATFDLVVVRDDRGGASNDPFTALEDPLDQKPGVRVVTEQKVPFKEDFLGNDRVGGDPAIAVDPTDGKTVYIAWSDLVGTEYTLHVRRSTNGGATWSDDLRTISNAKNPGLAVNNQRKVGFLYQQVEKKGNPAKEHWVTRFERTTDGFGTHKDFVLSDVPADEPTPKFLPYLGDYLHLMSVGKDFYGVFSANNTPDMENFPSGVKYQRNADFNQKKLLRSDNQTVVPISIDPFFFTVTETAQ